MIRHYVLANLAFRLLIDAHGFLVVKKKKKKKKKKKQKKEKKKGKKKELKRIP